MSREDGAAGGPGKNRGGGGQWGAPSQSDSSSASSWLVKLLQPGLVLLMAPLPVYTALRTCSPHSCWGAMAQTCPQSRPMPTKAPPSGLVTLQ